MTIKTLVIECLVYARLKERISSVEKNLFFCLGFDESKEREVLVAIAEGLQTPSKIAKEIKTIPNAISVYLGYLEERGYVAKKEKGIYVIEDAVFEKWLKRSIRGYNSQ